MSGLSIFDLSGRAAVVWGGGGAIGSAIAATLGRPERRSRSFDQDPDGLRRLKPSCRDAGVDLSGPLWKMRRTARSATGSCP